VTEHREDLSTADLAGQQPASPDRMEHVDTDRAEFDRSDVDGPDTDRPGVDRSDVDGPGFDRSDLEGGDFARDGDLRDRDAGTDGYDTDVTPAQGPVGSTGPVAGSTGPGVDTTGPGMTGPGATGPTAGPGADTPGTSGTAPGSTHGPLLNGTDTEGFRARWTDVQTGFVDEPRHAVEQADGLVAELMQHLAKTFADERGRLEGQWDRGDDVPTDDLRTAFQRYRSFFERLLAT
jgi:hypothetical protein